MDFMYWIGANAYLGHFNFDKPIVKVQDTTVDGCVQLYIDCPWIFLYGIYWVDCKYCYLGHYFLYDVYSVNAYAKPGVWIGTLAPGRDSDLVLTREGVNGRFLFETWNLVVKHNRKLLVQHNRNKTK